MRASKSTQRWSSSDSSSDSSSSEEPHEENNSTGGSFNGARMVIATAVAVVVVAVAWEEEEDRSGGDESSMGDATAIAIVVAGAVIAAWVISRILSNYNTNTKERNHRRYKMNTDGSCRPTHQLTDEVRQGPSGYGGILRDHDGNWVRGFIGFIGESDGLTSEFHGILKGLELLDKLNLTGSVLETDCEAAFKWIHEPESIVGWRNPKRNKSPIIRGSSDMILECRQLAAKNNIEIKHIPEKDNKCADKLSKMAIDRARWYTGIRHLPPELRNLVENEIQMAAG